MSLLRFAVQGVLAATRTVFAKLKTIWIVAAVFFGRVVAFLALIALQGNYGPNVLLL